MHLSQPSRPPGASARARRGRHIASRGACISQSQKTEFAPATGPGRPGSARSRLAGRRDIMYDDGRPPHRIAAAARPLRGRANTGLSRVAAVAAAGLEIGPAARRRAFYRGSRAGERGSIMWDDARRRGASKVQTMSVLCARA